MLSILKKLFVKQDPAALVEQIQKGATLVDVRTPGEFASGSAPGAINVPLNNIVQDANILRGKGNIVVFCRSGSRSQMAQLLLQKAGIHNVTNGGTWQKVAAIVDQN